MFNTRQFMQAAKVGNLSDVRKWYDAGQAINAENETVGWLVCARAHSPRSP